MRAAAQAARRIEPIPFRLGFWQMQNPRHYRSQADVAQRLADRINNEEAAVSLEKLAEDLREVAEDLETGAVEIRHPERLPQRKH